MVGNFSEQLSQPIINATHEQHYSKIPLYGAQHYPRSNYQSRL